LWRKCECDVNCCPGEYSFTHSFLGWDSWAVYFQHNKTESYIHKIEIQFQVQGLYLYSLLYS
jgi:hypothetical protein